jgi:hypothetical protein
MTRTFTMTVVCLEVKNLIIGETVKNMIAAGRLKDTANAVGYRYHLSRASANRIIEEWETSKRLVQ